MMLDCVGVFMSPVISVMNTVRRGCLSIQRSGFVFLSLIVLNGLTGSVSVAAANAEKEPRLTLSQAISFALEHDPWLSGSRFDQQATEAKAESAYQLPDPKFSLALANLPTDTFDFEQEAMTQLIVGVSQSYPRGNSRQLKRQQLYQQSERQPLLRREREAKLALTVTQLWLDAYLSRESVRLIEQDMALFDQLADISMARYTSALGRTRQQDLIQAQLEQIRITDRLTRLQQKRDVAEQKLLEWLLPSFSETGQDIYIAEAYSDELPRLSPISPGILQAKDITNRELADYFVHHPLVQALDQNIEMAGTGVQLAKQKYKPQWGVNASYGYRGETPDGRDRADLFSAAVTVSMPLFSSTAQDKEVEAAIASQEKIRTERSLMIRQMMSAFRSAQAQISRLDQRQQLYQDKLLPQVKRQAKAALNGYESDNGSFTEVIRARISELNTRIEYLDIQVEQLRQIAQLNYVLTTTAPESDATTETRLYKEPGNKALKNTGASS